MNKHLNKRKIAKQLFLPLDIIIVVIIGIYGFTFRETNTTIEFGSFVITMLSILLLAFDYYQFKYINVKLISVLGIFILTCHMFSFGEFYVCCFGQKEKLVYTTWFSTALDIKIRTGLYMLAALQSVYVGIYSFLLYSNHRKNQRGLEKNLKDIQWVKIGIVFLAVALPCRLYWDYLNILQGRLSNIYAGGASVSGLVDDLQVLFIPGVISLLHGLRKNRIRVITIISIIVAIEFFVMASSGNRRLYITSLMGILLYYYYEYPWKKRPLLKVLLFAVIGIVVLNFLVLIRKLRFVGLGSTFYGLFTFTDLFSLDFLWDILAEFGLTSHAIYYDFVYIKNSGFYFGLTFLTAILYILPVGFLVNVNRQGASIIENLSGSAVGGSIINDLYINWGWAGLFIAPFLGYFIARLSYKNIERGNITFDNIFSLFVFPFVLGYARGDIFEVVRPVAYVYILFYICTKYIWKPQIIQKNCAS